MNMSEEEIYLSQNPKQRKWSRETVRLRNTILKAFKKYKLDVRTAFCILDRVTFELLNEETEHSYDERIDPNTPKRKETKEAYDTIWAALDEYLINTVDTMKHARIIQNLYIKIRGMEESMLERELDEMSRNRAFYPWDERDESDYYFGFFGSRREAKHRE